MSADYKTTLENLNAAIKRRGVKPITIAVAAGLPIPTTVQKLAGMGELTVSEVVRICQVLEIAPGSLFITHRPCEVAACMLKSHEWQDEEQQGSCQHHRFEGVFSDCAYTVSVQKWPGESWVAYGEIDGGQEAHSGLKPIEEYHRDFVEALKIADRLNGADLHRATEPGAPAIENLGGVGL